MNERQLTLTRLLGKKELTFGCVMEIYHDGKNKYSQVVEGMSDVRFTRVIYEGSVISVDNWEIIGHPATETDFKRWLIKNFQSYTQWEVGITFIDYSGKQRVFLYNSSKDLLDQSPETIDRIIELISNNP